MYVCAYTHAPIRLYLVGCGIVFYDLSGPFCLLIRKCLKYSNL